MAVYKPIYRAYSGRLTSEWSRFFIRTRYALSNLFRSKFLTGAFVLCFFGPLVYMVGIYLNHNASVLALFHARANQFFSVDGKFFLGFIGMQCALAFFLTDV